MFKDIATSKHMVEVRRQRKIPFSCSAARVEHPLPTQPGVLNAVLKVLQGPLGHLLRVFGGFAEFDGQAIL